MKQDHLKPLYLFCSRLDEKSVQTHEKVCKPPIFVQDWRKSLCKPTKSLQTPYVCSRLDEKFVQTYEKFALQTQPPIFFPPPKTSPLETTGRKGHKPLRKVYKKLFSQLQNRKPSRRLRASGRRLDGDPRKVKKDHLEPPYILSNPLYFNFARFRFLQLLSF